MGWESFLIRIKKNRSWRHCSTSQTFQKRTGYQGREKGSVVLNHHIIMSRASHRAWQMCSINAGWTDMHRAIRCIRERCWEDPVKEDPLLFYSHPLQRLQVSGSSTLELIPSPFEYDHNQNASASGTSHHPGKVVAQYVRRMGSESAQFGFNSHLCPLAVVWHWTNLLISLHFFFYMQKAGFLKGLTTGSV